MNFGANRTCTLLRGSSHTKRKMKCKLIHHLHPNLAFKKFYHYWVKELRSPMYRAIADVDLLLLLIFANTHSLTQHQNSQAHLKQSHSISHSTGLPRGSPFPGARPYAAVMGHLTMIKAPRSDWSGSGTPGNSDPLAQPWCPRSSRRRNWLQFFKFG